MAGCVMICYAVIYSHGAASIDGKAVLANAAIRERSRLCEHFFKSIILSFHSVILLFLFRLWAYSARKFAGLRIACFRFA
jgi:hypothetical protein